VASLLNIAFLLLGAVLLLVLAFMTVKVVSNLRERSWKSVFWGSWLWDESLLNDQGRQYRRHYFLCLTAIVVFVLIYVLQARL